jgi:O-antigen/teichoic acid export membrane protein
MATQTSASTRPGGLRRRAILLDHMLDHVRIPLFRNGYALVVSHGVASGLGLVFWLLAARLYSPHVVGLNSALLAATMLVALIAQLNLSQALNRFLPCAGQRTARFIWMSYGLSTLMAVMVGAVFVLGVQVWAPALGFLRSDPALGAWFVTASALWCVFVLQDGALTGLREAGWVPLENAGFALAKIALLVLFAVSVSAYGVYFAWTVPLLPLVIAVNVFLFRRLVPRHRERTLGREEPINLAQVRRFVAGEHVAALLRTGLSHLLPLIALTVAGAEATAYFSLSSTIADALFLTSGAMGTSLVVEGAHNPTRLIEYTYRTGVQTARLIVPAAVLLALAAPYLLRLFGPGYAAEGVTVLRLLCAAALPGIVTSLYMSMVRVQRRMRAMVLVTLALAALVLPISSVLLRVWGIVGIGVAWLVAHSVVAIVLLATQLRPVWVTHLSLPMMTRIAGLLRLVNGPLHRRRVVAGVSRILPRIDARVDARADADGGAPCDWQVHRVLPTVNDVSVATAGPPNRSPLAVVKLANSDCGAAALQREVNALTALSADPRLGSWRAMLPQVLSSGAVHSQRFVVERMVTGLDGRRCLADPEQRARMLAAAVATIGELHRRTAVTATVDSALLKRWVDEPLLALRAGTHRGASDQGIAWLRTALRDALEGRSVFVSWIHGDYTPSNILCSADGSEVHGIVDWELASPLALPDLDLCHLALTTRMIVEQRELGDVVRDMLAGGDDGILTELPPSTCTHLSGSPLVLLTWLHHTAANLGKSARYQRGRPWAIRNVEHVLAYLATESPTVAIAVARARAGGPPFPGGVR